MLRKKEKMKQYASIEYFINESRNGRNSTTEMCSCVFKSQYTQELSYEVQLFGALNSHYISNPYKNHWITCIWYFNHLRKNNSILFKTKRNVDTKVIYDNQRREIPVLTPERLTWGFINFINLIEVYNVHSNYVS